MYEVAAIWFIVVVGVALSVRSRSSDSDGCAPTVWSLIPWVGGALQYGKDSIRYLNQCRKHYGSAFKMVLAGRVITVICDTKGIDHIFRDRSKAFNTHLAHHQIAEAMGNVKRAGDVVHIINDRLLPLVTRALSREGLDRIVPAFNEDVGRSIEAMARQVRNSPNGKAISLLPFVSESIYHAVSKAAFGPLFPFHTYDDFEACDADLVLLISRIPILSRNVLKAQGRYVQALMDYINRAWTEGHMEGASSMISDMVSVLKDTDLDESDIAGTLFTIVWGMQANTMRIPYWIMVFLLNDPAAAAQVQEEVDREIKDNFGGDVKRFLATPFTALESHFPLVDSCIKEALRIGILQSALRQAHADTDIISETGRVRVRKGDVIMANISAFHMDPEVFEDPTTFRADRYLNDKKKIHLGFGGGSHLCKGRFLAMHVAKVFVVMCFRMFDMKLVDATGKSVIGNLPPPDTRRSISVLRPSSETELFVHARIRDEKDGSRFYSS